jgi:hypothetical protein
VITMLTSGRPDCMIGDGADAVLGELISPA